MFSVILRCERSEPRRMSGRSAGAVALRGPRLARAPRGDGITSRSAGRDDGIGFPYVFLIRNVSSFLSFFVSSSVSPV
jgi:hypothetical protein